MTAHITLPWPSVVLSPNSRSHWAVKAKAAKKYRHECFLACRIADIVPPETDGKLHFWIDFLPPRNGRIDADNCLARIKNGIDGIADYLGIDDSRFVFHPFVKEKNIGGCVKVRITAGPEA